MPTSTSSPLVNSLPHRSNTSATTTSASDSHLAPDHDYSVYQQQLASSGGNTNASSTVRNDNCMYNQSLNNGSSANTSLASKDHMYDPQKKPSMPPLIGNATTAASVVGTATTGGLFGYGPTLPHCHPHYRPRDGTMFVLGDVKSAVNPQQAGLGKALEMGGTSNRGVSNNQVQHHLNSGSCVTQGPNKSIGDSSAGICSTPYDYLYHSGSPYGYIDAHSAHLMAGASGDGSGQGGGGATNFMSQQSFYGSRDKSNTSTTSTGAGSYSMIPASTHQTAHLLGQHHHSAAAAAAAAATSFYYDYSAAYDSHHQAAMLAAVAASYPRSTFLSSTPSHYHLMPVPNPPSAGITSRSSPTIATSATQQNSNRTNQLHHPHHGVQDISSNSASGATTAGTAASVTNASRSPFTSQTPTTSQQVSSLGQTGKRPRGRPRKHPLPISTHLQQQSPSSAAVRQSAAARQTTAQTTQEETTFSKDQQLFSSSMSNAMNNRLSLDSHPQRLPKQLSFDLEYLSGLYTPATLSQLKLLSTTPSEHHTEVAEEYVAIGAPFNRLSLATYAYEISCRDMPTDSVISLIQEKLGKAGLLNAKNTREDKPFTASTSIGDIVENKQKSKVSNKKLSEIDNDEDEDMQEDKANSNSLEKSNEDNYYRKLPTARLKDSNYISDDSTDIISEMTEHASSSVNENKPSIEEENHCRIAAASGDETNENIELSNISKEQGESINIEQNIKLKKEEKFGVNHESNTFDSDSRTTSAERVADKNNLIIISKLKQRLLRINKALAFNLNTSFIWSSLNPKIPVRDLVISRYHMSALLNNSRVLVFRHQTHPLIHSMVDQWDYIEELDNQRIVAIRIVSGLLPIDWRKKYHEFMKPKLVQQIQQDLVQRQTEKGLSPASTLLLSKLTKIMTEHTQDNKTGFNDFLSYDEIKLLMYEHFDGILCSNATEPDWLPEPFILAAIDQCGSIRFVKCCGYHNYPSFVPEETIITNAVSGDVSKDSNLQSVERKSPDQLLKPTSSRKAAVTHPLYNLSNVKQSEATVETFSDQSRVTEKDNSNLSEMVDDDDPNKNNQLLEKTSSKFYEPSFSNTLVRIEYRHNRMNRVGRPLDLAIPASKQRVQVQDVALGEITEESLFVDQATAPEVAMVIYATIPGSQEHSVFIKGRNIYIRFKNFPAGPAKLFCGPLGHTGALLLTNGTVWCWSTQTPDEQQKPKGKIAVSIRQVGGSLSGCHVVDLVALGPEFLALTSDGIVHEWNNYSPYLKNNTQESGFSVDQEISLPYCITRPMIPEPIELTPDFQKRILSHARSSQPVYKLGNFHWFCSATQQHRQSEVQTGSSVCPDYVKAENFTFSQEEEKCENTEQEQNPLNSLSGPLASNVNSTPSSLATSPYLSEDILEWQRQAEIKRLYLNDKNDLIERLYFTEGITMFLYGSSEKFTYIENQLNQYRYSSHSRWQCSDELFLLMHAGFSKQHAEAVLDQVASHRGKPLTMNPVVVARMRLPAQHELSDNQLRQQLEYMATNSTSYRLLMSPTSIIVATLKQINLMEEIKRSLVKHIPVGIAGFHPSSYADSFTGFSPLYMGLTQDELKQLLRYLIEGEKRCQLQTQTRRSKGRVGRPKGSRTALRSSLSNRTKQYMFSKEFDDENEIFSTKSSSNLFGRLNNFNEPFSLTAATTQRPWELILNLLEFDSSRKKSNISNFSTNETKDETCNT